MELTRDLFFARLVVIALLLRRNLILPALLLAAGAVGCLVLAGSAAGTAFATLRPMADWPVGPAIAAGLVFVAILELCAASLIAGLRALLQLSCDIGRHRIGALLTIAALLIGAVTLWALSTGTAAPGAPALLPALAVALAAGALWFERAYRRPAYPGFRDFHGDVAAARRHLARASHGR